MASGTKSDFIMYHEQVHSGFTETLQQETEVFNAASQGAIVLKTKITMGDYDREGFFPAIQLINRRITAGTAALAAVADTPLTENEYVRVKLNRRIGPVAQTRDAWRKIGRDPEEMSFIIGVQSAKAVAIDMVNAGVRAAVAALSQTTGGQALIFDASVLSPGGTITSNHMISALALAGDSANGIVCWVMHSASYFALMQNQTSVVVSNVAGTVINAGTPITLGRPVVVTDSPALYTPGLSTPDSPKILGLRAGGVVLDESELQEIETATVTGQENLIQRIQGEYAFNVGVLGFKYDMASGENPDNTALALSTNWDEVDFDDKSKAGVVLKVDAA